MIVIKRELKCYFYQLVATDDIVSRINNYMKNLSPENHINSETIDKYSYYIINDYEARDNYVLFTIAKVNTDEDIKIDDIKSQKRDIVHKEETQGLATDAQFLYDFKNGILIQRRGQGLTNIDELRRFIACKLNIGFTYLNFALIKDKKGIEKLNEMNQVHDLIFKVALPKNLSLFADDVKDIEAGIELAKKLEADSIEMRVRGMKLDKGGIKNLFGILKSYKDNEAMGLDKLSIYGDNEIIDLVTHKLNYYKVLIVEELTNKIIYDFLEEAYITRWDDLSAYQVG
ncbi:hypothetical protein [Streptococcus sp. E17BB]|uniref:hypothetical protein n=1 Tax=Streptococcus sp. E17BB TaxID=3278714 RepID=UPI00359DB053